MKSGKGAVKLEEMLKWQPEELTPERLVQIYSFAYYMENDSKRLDAVITYTENRIFQIQR